MRDKYNKEFSTMTTKSEFISSYEEIKKAYKNVIKKLDAAVAHEEHGRPLEAAEAYVESIQLIDEAFTIPVGLPDSIETVLIEWNEACAIIEKMKTVKSEAMYRISHLKVKYPNIDVETCNGNASDNSCTRFYTQPTIFDVTNGSGTPMTYRDIMRDLRTVLGTRNVQVTFDTLFQSSAKLYKIQQDGTVTAIEGDTNMTLVLLCSSESQFSRLNGLYFIQCSLSDKEQSENAASSRNMMWVYPLLPKITNCYRTDYGAIILPDLENSLPGTSFGIIVPDENETRQFLLDLLEAVLAGKLIEIKEPSGSGTGSVTSATVSRSIVSTADFIARNLVRGAEKTGELMVTTTPYLISKMSPAPPDAAPVSSKVQTTVEVAKSATSITAGVTGWVAGKVGSASMAIGRYLAPHIQTQGAALLEKSFGYDPNAANEKMAGALTIAAGAVEGFSTVYSGLEESAKILGTSLSNNSVKIIEHKYGPSAAVVASDTFETLGNAFNVTQNVNYITPKGIAKGVAKKTGKAVFVDYSKGIREESHYVAAGNLCPDLKGLRDFSSSK